MLASRFEGRHSEQKTAVKSSWKTVNFTACFNVERFVSQRKGEMLIKIVPFVNSSVYCTLSRLCPVIMWTTSASMMATRFRIESADALREELSHFIMRKTFSPSIGVGYERERGEEEAKKTILKPEEQWTFLWRGRGGRTKAENSHFHFNGFQRL